MHYRTEQDDCSQYRFSSLPCPVWSWSEWVVAGQFALLPRFISFDECLPYGVTWEVSGLTHFI